MSRGAKFYWTRENKNAKWIRIIEVANTSRLTIWSKQDENWLAGILAENAAVTKKTEGAFVSSVSFSYADLGRNR